MIKHVFIIALLTFGLAHGVFAQATNPDVIQQLLQRIEMLERRVSELEPKAVPSPTAPVLPSAEIAAQVESLDQAIRIAERKRELDAEAAALITSTAAVVGADGNGFLIRSADSGYQLRLAGLFQADGRFFAGPNQVDTNSFSVRRIRPIVQGTVARIVDFRITPDFGDGKTVLQDAYFDFRYWPKSAVRFGKFKAPFGLERLQSASDLTFIERALPTNLVPNRDEGVQLSGDILGAKLSYAISVMNGVPDGGSADLDNNDGKDAVARLFYQPIAGLGFGIAGSTGKQDGTTLPSYKTTGQSTFFTYVSGVTAVGRRDRYSPQAYYYRGPLGVIAEYVNSAQRVRRGSTIQTFRNESWHLTASYYVTGEKAGYRPPTPLKSFDPRQGNRGAFQIAARFAELSLDPTLFDLGFADLTRSARRAREWTVGANWFFNRHSKLILDYEQTHFLGGRTQGNRTIERGILSRFQVSF
jgi:phosphate-selective porin OprO and OprP